MLKKILQLLRSKIFPAANPTGAYVARHVDSSSVVRDESGTPNKPKTSATLSWSVVEGYPFKICRVPGIDALERLSEQQSDGVTVLMGDPEHFQHVLETFRSNDKHSLNQLLRLASGIDPIEWLRQRKEQDTEYYAIEPSEWPSSDAVGSLRIGAHCNVLTGNPYEEVVLSLVPTLKHWEVPCHLKIGNWNEMPGGEVQSALHKYWYEQYGAKIVAYTNDVIECTVERPPATREAALQLAREQFVYCPDIVYQGVETIENLAATLQASHVWYFWWD